MPTAGRDAARTLASGDTNGLHDAPMVRPIHQPDGKLLRAGKMQGDIAAIVDIGAIEPRRGQHGAEDFLCDAARNGRHRRNKMIGRKRRHGRVHAACDDAAQRAAGGIGGLSKLGQFFAEFIEQSVEAPRRRLIGRPHLAIASACANDQIDRTILQMQPLAVRKKRDLREPLHVRWPGM